MPGLILAGKFQDSGSWPGIAAFVDEVPELLGLRQFFVFSSEGKLGAEQEVLKGVLVEDTVNLHMVIKDLKIKTPVL